MVYIQANSNLENNLNVSKFTIACHDLYVTVIPHYCADSAETSRHDQQEAAKGKYKCATGQNLTVKVFSTKNRCTIYEMVQ